MIRLEKAPLPGTGLLTVTCFPASCLGALEREGSEVSAASRFRPACPFGDLQHSFGIDLAFEAGEEGAATGGRQLARVKASVKGKGSDTCADRPVHRGRLPPASMILSHTSPPNTLWGECTAKPYKWQVLSTKGEGWVSDFWTTARG